MYCQIPPNRVQKLNRSIDPVPNQGLYGYEGSGITNKLDGYLKNLTRCGVESHQEYGKNMDIQLTMNINNCLIVEISWDVTG